MKKKKFYPVMLVNIHSLKVIFITTALIFSTGANAQNWSLQQCIDSARLHNKNLQISRNSMEIGEERQQEANANLIPKINLNADYKYFVDLPYQLMPQAAFGGPEGLYKEVQMGVPHNMGANIQLTMPLYNPQIYGSIKTTGIAAEMNALQYKKTEEQVYFELSNLYYNAQILIHQQAFLDSNLVNTGKLLVTLELLHAQLMVTKSDVTKVELQQQQITTQRELVANNFEQVMNALKFMMGIPFDQKIQIEPEIKHNSGIDYPNLSPVDLEIANTQHKLLSSEMHSLKYSRLPSVSLYGSYGQTGFGYDEKPNDFLKFYPTSFVGLQLSVPVFNGTITRRKINQKTLEIKNSQLQIDLVTEQNQMLIENASRKRLVTSQTIENTQAQTALANTIYQQMLLQQKEGTASLTEVLLADNVLREAQQSYLSAIIDFLKADLELKKLTGNISSNH
ncbi:MAG: TolC family protein [Lentimicrobium sp.]|jgi:OMF family outer membrane factor|nr:TolC family protein [Lentimicrobium sp.]